jgi:hypothetical protein
LGGGLNLYGYAGGDPVNHSDPFGLSPDTVVYEDPTAQAHVEKCRAASAQCEQSYQDLHSDSRVWNVRSGPLPRGNPGLTTFNYRLDAAGNVLELGGGTITLDQSNTLAAAADIGVIVPMTAVVGHEFGHAVGALMGLAAGIRTPAPCDHRCANLFENIVRSQASLPPRP